MIAKRILRGIFDDCRLFFEFLVEGLVLSFELLSFLYETNSTSTFIKLEFLINYCVA